MNTGLYQRAMLDAFSKLNPRQMVRNPVMFVVEVGSVMTTGLFALRLLLARRGARRLYRGDFSLAVVHGAFCQLLRSVS